MSRYRIVRQDDRYYIQKWFGRSLFYKAGWYYKWGDGWSSYPRSSDRTFEEAMARYLEYLVEDGLPPGSPEPAAGLGPDGEALRAACKAAPYDHAPWLAFADWCDEHGYPASAARVRERQRRLGELEAF